MTDTVTANASTPDDPAASAELAPPAYPVRTPLERQCDDIFNWSAFWAAVDELPSEYATLVKRRYTRDGQFRTTLAELAIQYERSTTTIQHRISKALRLLKHPYHSGMWRRGWTQERFDAYRAEQAQRSAAHRAEQQAKLAAQAAAKQQKREKTLARLAGRPYPFTYPHRNGGHEPPELEGWYWIEYSNGTLVVVFKSLRNGFYLAGKETPVGPGTFQDCRWYGPIPGPKRAK